MSSPLLPPDPALASSRVGYDAEAVAALVQRRRGVVAADLRLRYLEHVPGERFLARWRGRVEGQAVGFVVSAGWHRAHHDHRAHEPELTWFPEDPALGALEDLDGDVMVWVPFQRAVVRAGHRITKVYATDTELERAVGALAAVRGVVATPAVLDVDRPRHLFVQELVDGTAFDGDDAVAIGPYAGELLRALHRDADLVTSWCQTPGHQVGPGEVLGACVPVAALITMVAPELAGRITAAMARLEATRPDPRPTVLSHGDLNAGQFVGTARAGGLTLVDLDTLCAAPAALDVASYATNLISGRRDDVERADDALASLLAGYGPAPTDLGWYLAATCLRRLDRAVRRAKKDWPARTERVLVAVEGYLDRR